MQELQFFSFPIGIQLHYAQAGLGSEDELAKGRQTGTYSFWLRATRLQGFRERQMGLLCSFESENMWLGKPKLIK